MIAAKRRLALFYSSKTERIRKWITALEDNFVKPGSYLRGFPAAQLICALILPFRTAKQRKGRDAAPLKALFNHSLSKVRLANLYSIHDFQLFYSSTWLYSHSY